MGSQRKHKLNTNTGTLWMQSDKMDDSTVGISVRMVRECGGGEMASMAEPYR